MRWSPGRWEWPGLQSFFLDGVSAAVVNRAPLADGLRLARRRWHKGADCCLEVLGKTRLLQKDVCSSMKHSVADGGLERGRQHDDWQTVRSRALAQCLEYFHPVNLRQPKI